MAQSKTDRVKQAVQADAKSRDWKKEIEKRKTVTVTALTAAPDNSIQFVIS